MAFRSSGKEALHRRNDALEFLIAGASAVGVGTALFYDPLVCKKINAGITDYLQRHGFSSVKELVGTSSAHAMARPQAQVC